MSAQLLEQSFAAPPKIAGGTLTSLGASTNSDITINGVAGIRLVKASMTTISLVGLYQTKPGTQWTLVARIRRHLPLGGNHALGVLMRESGSGKCALFGWTQSGVGRQRFSGLTTLSGTDAWAGGAAGSYCPWDGWLKVVRDSNSKYNYLLFVSQAETENLLREALDKAGVTVERNLTFFALGQADRETTVTAVLRRGDGSLEQFECSYLIDAEGAHSTARGTVGLHFEGKSLVEDYALGDLYADADLAELLARHVPVRHLRVETQIDM